MLVPSHVPAAISLTPTEVWGSLNILPEELISQILSYIKTPDLLRSLTPLNHRWRIYIKTEVCVRFELYRLSQLINTLRNQLQVIGKDIPREITGINKILVEIEKTCLVQNYCRQAIPLPAFLSYKRRILLKVLDSVPAEVVQKIDLTQLWLPSGFNDFISISLERHEVKRILAISDTYRQIDAISTFLELPFLTTNGLEKKLEAIMFFDVEIPQEEHVLSQMNKILLGIFFKRGELSRALEIISDCDLIVSHIQRTIRTLSLLSDRFLQSDALWKFGNELQKLNCMGDAFQAALHIVESPRRNDLLGRMVRKLLSPENTGDNRFTLADRIIARIDDVNLRHQLELLVSAPNSDSHKRKKNESDYFIH